jgi:hypothetical protein
MNSQPPKLSEPIEVPTFATPPAFPIHHEPSDVEYNEQAYDKLLQSIVSLKEQLEILEIEILTLDDPITVVSRKGTRDEVAIELCKNEMLLEEYQAARTRGAFTSPGSAKAGKRRDSRRRNTSTVGSPVPVPLSHPTTLPFEEPTSLSQTKTTVITISPRDASLPFRSLLPTISPIFNKAPWCPLDWAKASLPDALFTAAKEAYPVMYAYNSKEHLLKGYSYCDGYVCGFSSLDLIKKMANIYTVMCRRNDPWCAIEFYRNDETCPSLVFRYDNIRRPTVYFESSDGTPALPPVYL